MNPIIKLYKSLVYHDWEIAFPENSLEGIVKGEDLKVHVMKHPYHDRWFADPFILDVTETEIILLVEVVEDKTQKGVIAKLVVDKSTYTMKSLKTILELPTHLSFPVIVRDSKRILVYPESGASGKLMIYEYNPNDESLKPLYSIMDQYLADAIITDVFGKKLMFATLKGEENGQNLTIYESVATDKWKLHSTIHFGDNIARMAGEFFKVGNKIYRPAQESNTIYGHGMVIQEMSMNGNKWDVKEIRRITSPSKRYDQATHTLNYYKGQTVIDVKGYRHYYIGKFIIGLKNLFIRKI